MLLAKCRNRQLGKNKSAKVNSNTWLIFNYNSKNIRGESMGCLISAAGKTEYLRVKEWH